MERNKNLKTSFQNKIERFLEIAESYQLICWENSQRRMNNLKHRMRFSAIPESDEKTSESPARPTRMSETPKTNGKTHA